MKPWIDGPKELLNHASTHLNEDSDFDRRIAFISIDNAIEISIKTVLSLPKRIRRTQGPTRKELQDAESSFPAYLDLLEKYDADKLLDINLEEIEWYHRIRNQLYHTGNGITVDKSKVEAYFEIARGLFFNLFNEKADEIVTNPHTTNLGKFMLAWTELEKKLRSMLPPKGDNYAYYWKRDFLRSIDPSLVLLFNETSDFRNKVVHGYYFKYSTNDFEEMIKNIELIDKYLDKNNKSSKSQVNSHNK